MRKYIWALSDESVKVWFDRKVMALKPHEKLQEA